MRAYKQISSKLLWAEIAGDAVTLLSIVDDAQNIFVLDKNDQETSIRISKPENITNIAQIIEGYNLIIQVTGDNNIEQSKYYLYSKLNDAKYKKYYDGRTETGAFQP